MSRKTLIIVLLTLSIFTIFNSAFLFSRYSTNRRTVVIDVMRIFNEFKLKKDLESRVAVRLNAYSSSIDSLKAVYRALSQNKANNEIIVATGIALDTLQSQAQRTYLISDKNINEQVWVRLNSLINEWGQKNDYLLAIGANGMGTVLYNEKGIDRTDELIKFINEKYELGH